MSTTVDVAEIKMQVVSEFMADQKKNGADPRFMDYIAQLRTYAQNMDVGKAHIMEAEENLDRLKSKLKHNEGAFAAVREIALKYVPRELVAEKAKELGVQDPPVNRASRRAAASKKKKADKKGAGDGAA